MMRFIVGVIMGIMLSYIGPGPVVLAIQAVVAFGRSL